MGITEYNNLIKQRDDNMVNSGKDKIVRNARGAYPHAKDDLLELEAKVADMKAKWKAYEESLIEPVIVEEVIEEVIEGPTEEELKTIKEAEELAAKKAKLQAELDALNG